VITNLYLVTLGAVAFWLITRFIADVRAGIYSGGKPQRLDISTALARHKRIEQLAAEQQALDAERKVIENHREAN
jgi:hypothetical protein